jgi:heme O synthase-like polyprenyltransferase
LPAVALIPLGLLPTFIDGTHRIYRVGAFLISSGFAGYAAQLALRKSNASARRLLLASIFYLPALLVLWLLERASA